MKKRRRWWVLLALAATLAVLAALAVPLLVGGPPPASMLRNASTRPRRASGETARITVFLGIIWIALVAPRMAPPSSAMPNHGARASTISPAQYPRTPPTVYMPLYRMSPSDRMPVAPMTAPTPGAPVSRPYPVAPTPWMSAKIGSSAR